LEPLTREGTEIHVWAVDLRGDGPAAGLTLSDDERSRAARFVLPVHRRRFRSARHALRSILSRYTSVAPERLVFDYGPHGKPELSDRSVCFNLSHCGDLALVAVTRLGPVGVDVERIRPSPSLSRLARRVLSAQERKCLWELPEARRPEGFFLAWTRKEALVKMLGEGIFSGLRRLEVTLLPGEPARVLGYDDPNRGPEARRWRLHDLQPAPGFAAAVATVGAVPSAPRIRTWKWVETLEEMF